MMYIQPEECINCGVCLSVCPVQAIYDEDDLPKAEAEFKAINAEFFGPAVTGWGAPGGTGPDYVIDADHPQIASRPKPA
jgi:ferredoxin